MNTVWVFVERFSEIVTIILNLFFLYRVMDVKVQRKTQVVATVAFIIVRMLYYGFDFPYRPYFAVLAATIYAYFIFAGRLRRYVVWNVLAVVIDGIIDIAVVSAYLLLPKASIEIISTPGIERAIIVVVAKILLCISYYFATIKVDKNRKMSNEDFLLVLLIPIGCWTLLEVLFNHSSNLAMESESVLAEASIALLIILLSVIVLYNRITTNEKELARTKLQLRMSEMTEDHVAQVRSLYTQLSSVRHDLNGHFSSILGYVNSNDYDAIKEYISSLIDVGVDVLEHTDNNILNVLISTRASIAETHKIEFTSSIMLPEKMPINDVDLCILVSNILDNAFDAAQAAYEPRFINLNMRVVNSYWVIACRNSVRSRGNLRTSGNIESSKAVSELHGIGTKQIRDIAEKTGGFVTYKHENHEFTTLAMIKLPDNSLPALS